tara:strand:- start:188 stop:739 length:552 start_codon:yes stop_codon:yes gene_type:complete
MKGKDMENPLVNSPNVGLDFVYNDGGRSKYFKGKNAGDCVTRSIAIAGEYDYEWVYNSLAEEIKWYCSVHNDKIAKSYRKNFRGNWYDKSKTPRNGVHKEIYKGWLFKNNWQWRALQNFDPSDGHKKFYDLPKQGRIIVSCRRHLSSLVDGVVHDTWNASISEYEGETLWRSVLGYFHKVGGA